VKTTDRTAYDAAQRLVAAGVWTVDPDTGVVRGRGGRALGSHMPKGYLRAPLKVDGRQRFVYLHRVVWETLNGPIAAGLEIDHRNGRKDDNRPSNLDVVTTRENLRRARATGLLNDVGHANSRASMTPTLVSHLHRVGGPSGLTHRQLAPFYGVSSTTIQRVLAGTRYGR
jgi:hypothetical protein